MAGRLGRSASTVSREIARHGGRAHYRAAAAYCAAHERGHRPKQAKLGQQPAPRALVEAKLAPRWSPEQVSGRLRRQFPGAAPMRISHEAIYLTLFDPRRRHAIERALTQQLRTGRPMRRPEVAVRPTGRGVIRDMVSIIARPAEVEDRTVPGHWEGNLLMGTRPSATAMLVERTSLFTAIVALPRHQGRARRPAPHPPAPWHPAPATADADLGPGPRDGRTPSQHHRVGQRLHLVVVQRAPPRIALVLDSTHLLKDPSVLPPRPPLTHRRGHRRFALEVDDIGCRRKRRRARSLSDY
ncbi:IS30 family transposase [Streptomyces sp. NPDC046727]|uniref:IS30 family transposase n=1 Tax=Streptomyces sp. NPDC046727 TaxID=3155373 RepID=UPI0033E705BE